MSKVSVRLRRQLGEPRSFGHGPGAAAVSGRAALNAHAPRRESVSARLRRIFPVVSAELQHPLPGIAAVIAEDTCATMAGRPAGQSLVLEHRIAQTRLGGFVRGHAEVPPRYCHGALPLSSVAALDGEAAVLLSGDVSLAEFRPERALFFDLETTGLPGGSIAPGGSGSWRHHGNSRHRCAGTPLAFLIGAAQVDASGAVQLHQFLLRQQPDEPAQLAAFSQLLQQVDYLVSFNGRSFDRNILADRLARNGMDPERILTLPHLDLLHPSRRLYGAAFGSATLDVIERRVLGLRRPEDEVRGAQVPERWNRYLSTGDPRHLHAVLDHNVLDLLSLLTLGGHLSRCVRAPGLSLVEPVMLAAAARLLLRRGRPEQGESLLRRLAHGSADDLVVYGALGSLAEHLRRGARHGEAVVLWRRMLGAAGADDLQPWRSAAISLERRLKRPAEALALVEDVLGRLEAGEGLGSEAPLFPEFVARRERLRRKVVSEAA